MLFPVVAKVGGLLSQGAGGEAVPPGAPTANPAACGTTPGLKSSGLPDLLVVKSSPGVGTANRYALDEITAGYAVIVSIQSSTGHVLNKG